MYRIRPGCAAYTRMNTIPWEVGEVRSQAGRMRYRGGHYENPGD